MATLRPRPNGSLVITVRLTLQPGRDDDLIDLVKSAPAGALAAIIREAMRNGVHSTEPLFEDVDDTEQPLEWSDLGMDV